jgi:hypothetical protein
MRASFVDLSNDTAQLDCFAPLAMTTKEKRKRNADRRMCPTSASRDAARTSGCARLSAFHYGSYRQGFRPLGATPGQASWDVAGRSILYGRPNRGAKISRSYAGVTRARLSQSRECTSRTGRSAGQHDARSCPGAECIVPRAGTALASTSRNTFATGVLGERDSFPIIGMGTIVNGNATSLRRPYAARSPEE